MRNGHGGYFDAALWVLTQRSPVPDEELLDVPEEVDSDAPGSRQALIDLARALRSGQLRAWASLYRSLDPDAGAEGPYLELEATGLEDQMIPPGL